jgi:hypothetical protein
MKLYTEEELLKAMSYSRSYDANWVMTENEILKLITPIELPSDEDIESGMNQRLFLSDKNAHFNSGAKAGFKLGAKWMKEQIHNQNK